MFQFGLDDVAVVIFNLRMSSPGFVSL